MSTAFIWYYVILQILSNGAYTSIEHRATVNSEKERISIAMYFNPKFEAKIGPLTSILSPQNPPLFKSIGMEEYVKDFFSRNINGKSHLEKMRIKSGDGNMMAKHIYIYMCVCVCVCV